MKIKIEKEIWELWLILLYGGLMLALMVFGFPLLYWLLGMTD